MSPPGYNPKTGTYTGAILVNLGYITPDQQQKVEVLDAMAKTLAANNPDFKKPFYGQIASGAGAEKIMTELQKQVDAGKIKVDDPQKLKLDGMKSVELSIKGEQAGSDIERKGGPIDNMLKVQKELRDLDRMEMLPKTEDEMSKMTRKIADNLGLNYPAKPIEKAELNRDDHVEGLMRVATEASATHHVEPPIERRNS